MANHQQKEVVSTPQPTDTALRGFSGTVQRNFFDLWQLSHDHVVSPTVKAEYAALTTDAQRVAYIASFLGLS